MHAEEEIREILRRNPPLPHYAVKRLADLLRRNGIDPFDLAEILGVEDGISELLRDLRRLQRAIHPELMRLKAAEESVCHLAKRSSHADHPRSGVARPSLCQEMWWEWGVIFPPFDFMIPTRFTQESQVRTAIKHLLEIYPVLRASFVFENDRLELAFNDPAKFVLEHPQDPARLIDPDCASRLDSFPAWGAPIANGDIWQIRMMALQDHGGAYALAFNVGHMIFDDASIQIFSRNLGRIFGDLSRGRPLGLADKTYFEMAQPERDWLENGEGAALLAYWRAALQDVPVIRSPRGRRLEHWQRGLSAHCALTFGQSVRRRIANWARDLKVSMLVVLVYILAKAISRWSGAGRLVIRSLRNKRNSLRTLNMVGFWTAADIIFVEDIDRPPAEVVRDISLSLDCARRLNLPQQRGDWLRIQKTIPLTLNYIPETGARNSCEQSVDPVCSSRDSINCHMSSAEQAEKPNIVLSIRDNGTAMHMTVVFSDASSDCDDENDLLDLIFAEFTAPEQHQA